MDSILIIIAISILIFLACREFFCWYFKLTKIKNLLEEINQSLKTISLNNLTKDKDNKENQD